MQVGFDLSVAPTYRDHRVFCHDLRLMGHRNRTKLRPDSTLAFLQWEDKRIAFKIEEPRINELYVAEMRKELQNWAGFNYQNWQNAAQFCADNKLNLQEALIWAEKAIHKPFRGAAIGSEDFSTLQTKAAVLRAMERTKEADATMEKAFFCPGPICFRSIFMLPDSWPRGEKRRRWRFLSSTSNTLRRNLLRSLGWPAHIPRWVTRRTPFKIGRLRCATFPKTAKARVPVMSRR
jgi:hypothetical protein